MKLGRGGDGFFCEDQGKITSSRNNENLMCEDDLDEGTNLIDIVEAEIETLNSCGDELDENTSTDDVNDNASTEQVQRKKKSSLFRHGASRKTISLRLTSDQLKSLDLNKGSNDITFSVMTNSQVCI